MLIRKGEEIHKGEVFQRLIPYGEGKKGCHGCISKKMGWPCLVIVQSYYFDYRINKPFTSIFSLLYLRFVPCPVDLNVLGVSGQDMFPLSRNKH